MRSSFSMFLLYHAYIYLELLILTCTIYILAPDLIGNKVTIDTIIAGISFLLSVFTASYDDLLGIRGAGIALKTIFCMIGIVYCLKIVKDVSEMVKNKYDHEVLLQENEQ